MNEFQQIMNGGAGAAGFYLLYQGVNIVKGFIDKKTKNGKPVCEQHGALIVHLESIKEKVDDTKEDVGILIREVSEIKGRLDG